MNKDIVNRRISQVLRIDSIDSRESDFLATHVPFSNIAVLSRNGGVNEETKKSEEEIYRDIFETVNSRDEHQFIIVEGSSGAGKSHFIRWLHARLKMSHEQNDVILLIRRSDNTLKGTIRQLLDIDEVKKLANKEAYERLVKANQTISEEKFKSTIYHQFIIELENDTSGTLNRVKLKKLIALFNNSVFQDRMTEPGGPIERICNKIKSSGSDTDTDSIAQFRSEDLTLDIDFVEKLDDADKKARDFANSLLEGDDDEFICSITDFLNSFVESVIQTCAGIEPGDFQQIFKEIRQELKRQGRDLILLVEDITSFTGINQALLNALVTSHTGENASDNMCRLISVVGTTSEYYRQFRDNYRDRITRQITIHDGALGERKSDIVQFVAKYLNALSLEESELDAWARNGAHADELPVSEDKEHQYWDNYAYSKTKNIPLYPFTVKAILNLYDSMPDHKTPRYILRDIVEPAVREVIADVSSFPRFCISSEWRCPLAESVENRIGSITSSLSLSNDEKAFYRNRLVAFIKFWTNKTLDVTSDGRISGVRKELFSDLHFDEFVDKLNKTSVITQITETSEEQTDESPIDNKGISSEKNTAAEKKPSIKQNIKKSPVIDPKRQEQYESFKHNVISWHRDGKILINSLPVREEISSFIYNSINWQQEGIPLDTQKRFENYMSSRIIGFRRQDQAEDKCIVVLEDTEETYQLLLCFGKWLYLGKKSWKFPDASSALFFATSWLIRYKQRFVEAVRNADPNTVPVYVKAAMIEQIIKRTLNGTIKTENRNDIKQSVFLMDDDVRTTSGSFLNGHSKVWYDLHSFVYSHSAAADSYTASVRYFNLIQGVQLNSSNYVLNYRSFTDAFTQVRSSGYMLNPKEVSELSNEVKERREIIELTLKTIEKLHRVVEEESRLAQNTAKKIIGFFDNIDYDDEIEESDVRTILNDILSFYEKCCQSDVNIHEVTEVSQKINEQIKNAKEISSALNLLKEDHSSLDDLDVLMLFSHNPIGCVMPFLELLKRADSDVDSVSKKMRAEKNSLIQQGSWSDNIDLRFENESADFEKLFDEFQGVK